MTLLAGRYCHVLDDEQAKQQLNVKNFDFPAELAGVLDYVRDVLVDPSFRDQDAADVHALRAMIEEWERAIADARVSYRSQREIYEACSKVLTFVKAHPLGVTVV